MTNARPATGGSAAESLDATKLRAPTELKVRDRAVTADDFAYHAQQTQGVAIHTAYALARRAVDVKSHRLYQKEGAVTVVILPGNTREETPQPSEQQLSAIANHLNSKRLITTEVFVTGPRYTAIEQLNVNVKVKPGADLQTVSEQIKNTLLNYFNPLTGGDQGKGWPFGENIYYGGIYRLLLSIAEVQRVINLDLHVEEEEEHAVAQEEYSDVVAIAEGRLPHLRADAIVLQVNYER